MNWLAILLPILVVLVVGLSSYLVGREVGREQGRVDAYRRMALARRRMDGARR